MPMLDEFRPNFNPDELRINEDFEIGVDLFLSVLLFINNININPYPIIYIL